LSLEALATNLLGIEAVDDRVVDLLEKVAVEALVDRPRDAIGVDQQHGDPRVGCGGRAGGKPAEPEGHAGDGYGAKRIGQQAARQGAPSLLQPERHTLAALSSAR